MLFTVSSEITGETRRVERFSYQITAGSLRKVPYVDYLLARRHDSKPSNRVLIKIPCGSRLTDESLDPISKGVNWS